jgi:hypothetical protein
MIFRQSLLVLSSVAVLVLGACSNNSSTPSQTGNTSSSTPAPTTETANPSPAPEALKSDNTASKQGGQVVKAGDYHLEFVPSKEGDGTHLDFFLYKGDSTEVIPDAKVVARVEFPDGTQKEIPLKYEAAGKHYGEKLSGGSVAGDYKVAILTDINGEKVNGRFSFAVE